MYMYHWLLMIVDEFWCVCILVYNTTGLWLSLLQGLLGRTEYRTCLYCAPRPSYDGETTACD